MKKLIYSVLILVGLLTTTTPVAALPTVLSPATHFAACASERILTFPTWYRGLQDPATCAVVFKDLNNIWVVALNLIEIGMQLAGYLAVGFLIWGGVLYIKSQGEPAQVTAAKNTILNAIVGLGIVLASVAIVNFIASRFTAS